MISFSRSLICYNVYVYFGNNSDWLNYVRTLFDYNSTNYFGVSDFDVSFWSVITRYIEIVCKALILNYLCDTYYTDILKKDLY